MADEISTAFKDMTAAEQLGVVNTAIYSILVGGQSYKIGSRNLVRADLSLLRAMREELQAEVAAENDSPFFDDTYVAVFQGR